MSLMRSAVSSVHCALRAGLDNERACRLPAPALAPVAATAASRNGRRCMEDRHVTIDDFDSLFGVQVSTNRFMDMTEPGYFKILSHLIINKTNGDQQGSHRLFRKDKLLHIPRLDYRWRRRLGSRNEIRICMTNDTMSNVKKYRMWEA